MLIIAQGNNSMVKSNITQNIIKNQVNEEERMIEEKKRDKKKRKKNLYIQTNKECNAKKGLQRKFNCVPEHAQRI